MEIRIRAGTAKDLERFWPATLETVWTDLPANEREGLDRAAFEQYFRSHAEKVLASGENEMVIAEGPEGRFLGYALFGATSSMMAPAPFGFLYDLWVAPDARGRGVAKGLLDWVAAWGRAHGLGKLKLEVAATNGPARALYAATGFADERIFMGRPL